MRGSKRENLHHRAGGKLISMGSWCTKLSNYMGGWCPRKLNSMGGWVKKSAVFHPQVFVSGIALEAKQFYGNMMYNIFLLSGFILIL